MIPQAALTPIIRYLIRARSGESRPVDIQTLYDAVGDNAGAIAWLDRRFVDRELPPGWRDLENEIDELAFEAAGAGVQLERVSAELLDTSDPIGRLRGLIHLGQRRHAPSTEPLPPDRQPSLDDLIDTSRRRIELFAVEEGFHYGLPPIETSQLYDDVEADPRAIQYVNRRFAEGSEPNDWSDLRSEARSIADAYERLGYLPSAVLGEQHPRTSERSMRSILADLADQVSTLGGTVVR